jgi:hypothetical protein
MRLDNRVDLIDVDRQRLPADGEDDDGLLAPTRRSLEPAASVFSIRK